MMSNNVFLGFIIGFWLAFVAMVVAKENFDGRIQGVNQAVEQCEKELPRNLECEPVYNARVVED